MKSSKCPAWLFRQKKILSAKYFMTFFLHFSGSVSQMLSFNSPVAISMDYPFRVSPQEKSNGIKSNDLDGQLMSPNVDQYRAITQPIDPYRFFLIRKRPSNKTSPWTAPNCHALRMHWSLHYLSFLGFLSSKCGRLIDTISV